jgi:hypothetical protein
MPNAFMPNTESLSEVVTPPSYSCAGSKIQLPIVCPVGGEKLNDEALEWDRICFIQEFFLEKVLKC